ncbi:MAG: Gfo/Idh/MocA family oxidoreductase [Candidatus Solibacter usitatus]|nr:Gfo/Idh/MocA family oxidoreductase [Candidatus Solibacter usitatus]
MPNVRLFLFIAALGLAAAADIRLGIIGTDTSHVIAFTKSLNDPTSPDYVPGARVVAAYKGGSRDIPSSADRVDKYAEELRAKWKIDFTPDIGSLCRKVDGILLESLDGRVHLQQAKAVIAAGKPLFIDKPLASTLADAREIARLAKEAGVPWFSASGLRFGEIAASLKFTDTQGVTTWGPGPLEEHHQLDLSWYAIHPIELLYALMGPGCEEVTRVSTEGGDLVVGKWKGGRIGSVHALRPYGDYGAVVFRLKEIAQSRPKTPFSYRPLLLEIIKFFETKQPPVPNEETLEMFAFMDAAQRSKAAGGAPMKVR